MNTKKIVTIFLVLFGILLIGVGPSYAQNTPEEIKELSERRLPNRETYDQGFKLIHVLTKSPGENITQLSAKFITGTGDVLLGMACPECTEAADDIQASPDIPEEMKSGLVGVVDNQVMAMFNAYPRVDVMAHLAEEWIPGHREQQTVYAAGYDDLVGAGIDTLWSFTRNIAYLGFVVIMIIVGFMIMFRHKVGGQMLVTIGNAIPRVVIGLVLVTFSFAIAGIILDVTGVLMGVIAEILQSGIEVHNIFKLLTGTLGGIGLAITGGLGIVGTILLVTTVLMPLGPLMLIVALIVIGVVTVGAIKLWFALVKSYLALLLNVVVAPVVIMAGSLPGNQVMITNIFKSMLRNALVFPVAFAIVNLPHFIVDQQGIILSFPSSVVGGDTMTISRLGFLITGIMKIVAIYVAAQTPSFMKAIIPATASRAGADASAAVKEGFSKVPLIGGAFK